MLRCHTCMIRKWVVAADVMETVLDAACMIKNAVLENRLPVQVVYFYEILTKSDKCKVLQNVVNWMVSGTKYIKQAYKEYYVKWKNLPDFKIVLKSENLPNVKKY